MAEIPEADWSWIDAAARRFELAWKQGVRPRIEDFLAKVPEPRWPGLLAELLRVERELRQQAAEQPTAEEYRRRFPAHYDVVASVFGPGEDSPLATGRASLVNPMLVRSNSAPLLATSLPAELVNHPDYEIVRMLGRGGMGAVYLAHNRLMDRHEVLKVMGQEFVGQPRVLDRFLREIRAVARLRHPNIVSAYTAFRSSNSLVFAMEYVEGLDLRRMVKARGPMPIGHACYFVHQAAMALQHAHEEGMVHRDIKPGNLMLSHNKKRAMIKVLDFGLAKATSEQNASDVGIGWPTLEVHSADSLTRTGEMLGTPESIAPEQILDAQKADIRADVYSLGCTLYYLLSGRAPFQATTVYQVLLAHQTMDATPLILVRSEMPAELSALVAKMMAKEPDRRFQEPDEVAEALAPFFKKRPVGIGTPKIVGSIGAPPDIPFVTAEVTHAATPSAPVGAVLHRNTNRAESMWSSLIQLEETEGDWDDASAQVEPAPERPRWARIALGGLAGLAAILLGVAILVIGTGNGKIKDVGDMSSKAGTALASKADPGGAETGAVPTIPRGTSSPILPETATNEEIDRGVFAPRPEARSPVESLNTTPAPTAATLESHEIAAFKLLDPVIQVRWLREGGRVMIETGGKIRALWLAELAQPQNPRKLESPTPPWVHLSISCDGRVAVAACIDKTIWRWDLQTGQSRQLRTERASLTALALTPDDRRAVYVCRGEIQYFDLMTGDKDDLANRKLRERTGRMIERIWLCSDSNRVVSEDIDHGIRVWDLRKARASRDLSGGTGLAHLDVFPDGHRLLTSSSDGVIAIEDFDNGTRRVIGRLKDVADASISADGRRALFAARDVVLCQDLQTTRELKRIEHGQAVNRVALSSDGRLGAFSSDTTVRVWELPLGRQPGEQPPVNESALFLGHTHGLWSVAFSADGLSLLTTSHDFTVRHWDVRSGRELHCLRGHTHHVKTVSFLPDGRSGLSAGDDDMVRLWDLETGAQRHCFEGHTRDIQSVAVSRDGRRALSGADDLTVRLWDLEAGRDLGPPFRGHTAFISQVTILPDGRRALSSSLDGTVRLWHLVTRDQSRVFDLHAGPLYGVAASPDGHSALVTCQDGTVRVLDVQTGNEIGRLEHKGSVRRAAYTPDGRLAISGGGDTVRVWDMSTRRQVSELGGFRDVRDLAVSRDGRMVAVALGDADRIAQLWHLPARDGDGTARPLIKSPR
jgi:WD40 repeat protein/serine/threonine protein kinase